MKIIDYLLKNKLLNEELLKKAEYYAKCHSMKTEEIILIKHYVEEEQFLKIYAKLYKLEYIDSFNKKPLMDILPFKFIRDRGIIPIETNGKFTIAISNPYDDETLKDVEFLLNAPIKIILMPERLIKQIILKYYNNDSIDINSELLSKDLNININFKHKINEEDTVNLEKLAYQPPIIRLVNIFILEAIRKHATDIHIEPYKNKMIIRFRVDGRLQKYIELPAIYAPSIISRVKILASMNIAERRRAQDGSISMSIEDKAIDLRVSIVPTIYGEKIVIRVFDKSQALLKLENLGFNKSNLKIINRIISKPNGLLLVTGPTGSGKNTTLYSLINKLNKKDKNIITIEDPVEYKIENITQIQINERTGMNFASVLKSVLRQDPDIILIGELRDEETTKIAIQSALTGHLVLSTLHTNNAISAISRLRSMNIPNNLIADALIGIIAQRLIRKICPYCSEEVEINIEELQKMNIKANNPFYEIRGKGCNKCSNTGYKGRMVVEEIIEIDERIKLSINRNDDSKNILDYLKDKGFIDLKQNALEKVKQGITTIEEINEIIGIDCIYDDNNEVKEIEDKKSALIVDDSKTIRMILKTLLENNGFRVYEAENGRIALDILKKNKFIDLIILDLIMPEINGFEVLRRIREDINLQTPVIMLTTKAEIENELKSFEIGVDDFIPKPFDGEKFLYRVKAVMKRARNSNEKKQ